MIIISGDEIRSLISMEECIGEMKKLFLLDLNTSTSNPLRTKMEVNSGGLLGMMPASIEPYNILGIKILTIYPENYKEGLSSHQGILHLFSADRGQLLATFDADEITAIRTAAVSALMTDLLAIEDAETLCLMGSGKQAKKHLESILLVRKIRKVNIWSNSHANDIEFMKHAQKKYSTHFEVYRNAEDAVKEADVICTLTSSKETILNYNWLQPHTHINAVGACTPDARELDSNTVRKSDLYVDSYESALNEAGDILLACSGKNEASKLITASIEEVFKDGAVIDKNTLTVFESLGLAIEDIAAANYCLNKLNRNL